MSPRVMTPWGLHQVRIDINNVRVKTNKIEIQGVNDEKSLRFA